MTSPYAFEPEPGSESLEVKHGTTDCLMSLDRVWSPNTFSTALNIGQAVTDTFRRLALEVTIRECEGTQELALLNLEERS